MSGPDPGHFLPGPDPHHPQGFNTSVAQAFLIDDNRWMPPSARKYLPIIDSNRDSDRLKDMLASRKSSDLVFAVVGYVGSGASYVASVLAEQAGVLGFFASTIRLSDELASHMDITRSAQHTVSEVERLQNAGDELRLAHGASIVAGLGVSKIHALRQTKVDRPRLFIIDSLKHHAEVEILREIYGSSFYLIAIVCNEQTRRDRLELKFKSDQDKTTIDGLMVRDRAGTSRHGQHVHKTLHLADFFVANEDADKQRLATQLDRFLRAVAGRDVVRPTRDEQGMHAAWAASLRSSCLSRQVGAAIVGPTGELLATGTNDPPAPGGGVYHQGTTPDHRCFNWPGTRERGYCRNDSKKEEIYADVYQAMSKRGLLSGSTTPADIAIALSNTRIRDLIEFSRAVHAEMDALLELARSGGGIPKGSSLFCRTYPCHSCARHIVAAGLFEVVYIEPYDKSLALELHGDAIEEVSVPPRLEEHDGRVVFRLFGGVAPRRFAALFEKRRDLKDERGVLLQATDGPGHADPVLTGSFLELEKELAKDVESALETA